MIIPSDEQLSKHLRVTHKLYCLIKPTTQCYWTFEVIDIQCDPQKILKRNKVEIPIFDYDSYDEALKSAINYGLKMISYE